MGWTWQMNKNLPIGQLTEEPKVDRVVSMEKQKEEIRRKQNMLKLMIRADKRKVSTSRGEATRRLTMVTDGDLVVAIMSCRGQRRIPSG